MSKGTNENRRRRRSAQRQQKHVQQPTAQKEQVAMSAPTMTPTPITRHFGITQHFDITISELDFGDEEGEFKDYHEQMKRIFHVIISHPEIVKAICKWEVLSAMESTYVDEEYGDMNYFIGNILAQFLDCFIEEDQEYIRENKNDYDSFSIFSDHFQSEPSGYEVDEYEHVCPDCGHHH